MDRKNGQWTEEHRRGQKNTVVDRRTWWRTKEHGGELKNMAVNRGTWRAGYHGSGLDRVIVDRMVTMCPVTRCPVTRSPIMMCLVLIYCPLLMYHTCLNDLEMTCNGPTTPIVTTTRIWLCHTRSFSLLQSTTENEGKSTKAKKGQAGAAKRLLWKHPVNLRHKIKEARARSKPIRLNKTIKYKAV